MNDSLINIGIYVTYALIVIAILGILVFAVGNVVKKPAAAKSALIGIVGLAVILGVTYATSTGTDANTMFADENITEATSRGVGMGLTSFYILAGLAILSILYVEVTRLFK